jgi:hypothetical protein
MKYFDAILCFVMAALPLSVERLLRISTPDGSGANPLASRIQGGSDACGSSDFACVMVYLGIRALP